MHKFTRLLEPAYHQMTSRECSQLKKQFKIDDNRSSGMTAFNAFWFQFWAHQCLDSADSPEGKINRYDGLDNGQGVYPARMDSPLLEQGYFRTSGAGLPVMTDSNAKTFEMTVDAHRGNENRVLKANHLMAIKLHNRIMKDTDGDFELAKKRTIGRLNQITLNESLNLCQMDEKEFFEIRVENVNLSLEFNFAGARWAHAQMPETVHGDPLFTKGNSRDIDLKQLLLVEKARNLNLGVASAMQAMTHLPSTPHAILERTFSRHTELGLGCWQDLADLYGLVPDDDLPEGCPIWPAMLLEAEKNDNMLGDIGRRFVADGLAGSLSWGNPDQGCWERGWGADTPYETLDILEYAES